MDYMRNINKLYDKQLSLDLSTGQIALWHGLMNIANRQRWPDWFFAPNRQLQVYSGMTASQVCRVCDELVRKGLIDIRGAKKKREYHIIDLASPVDNPVDNVENLSI